MFEDFIKKFNERTNIIVLLLKAIGYLLALFSYLTYAEHFVTSFFDQLASPVLVKIIFYAIPAMLFFVFTSIILYFSNRAYRDGHRKYLACEVHFRTIANNNAITDGKLFDDLFSRIASAVSKKMGKTPGLRSLSVDVENAIASAERTIRNDIERMLAEAAQILSTLTGCEDCAVSFKRIEGTELISFARDSRSHAQRPNTRQAMNETPFNGVLRGESDHFGIENIAKWPANVPYVDTELAQLATKYRAILVIPIRDLADVSQKVGVLQADNRRGGLVNDRSRHYITELSYRFSVLLYRIVALEAQGRQALGGQIH